jgi:Spy/CpxP family protein refolding chaperone
MNENTAKRRAAFWVAAVFVFGMALGGVFGYFYGHRGTVAAAPPPMSDAERHAKRLDQLTRELGLNDSQRQQMDLLLTQAHVDFQSVRTKHGQLLEVDMDQVRQKSRDQMRAILTSEQLPKFEEFLKRLDEERKKNGPPPGMPPVPPPSR